MAQYLLETGDYVRYYGDAHPFPIETDSVFVFLAALTSLTFGNGLFASQLPNVIFVLTLFWALNVVFSDLARSLPLGTACVLLITLTPGFYPFAFDGYGEVPMLSILLWAWIALYRAWEENRLLLISLSGALLGIAASVKIVAIIALPILFFLPPFLFSASYRRALVRLGAQVCGFSVAYGAWELFKLSQMGSVAWITWWEARSAGVFSRAGLSATGQTIVGTLEKASTHIGILAGFYGIPTLTAALLTVLFVGTFGAIACILLMARIRKRPAKLIPHPHIVFAGALACAYLIWWILLTPTQQAWLRRLDPGLIALHVTVIGALLSLVDYTAKRKGLVSGGVLCTGSFILVAGSVLWWSSRAPSLFTQSATASSDFRQLVSAMSDLPQTARVFGVGWYSAPQWAYYSNRRFDDLATTPVSSILADDSFLLFDHNAVSVLGPPQSSLPTVPTMIRRLELSPVVLNSHAQLFRICGLLPLPLPTERAIRFSRIDAESFSQAADANLLSGAFTSSHGIVASTLIECWIWAPNPKVVTFSGNTFPDWVYRSRFSSKAIPNGRVRIEIDGCHTIEADITVPSAFEFVWPVVSDVVTPSGWRRVRISTDFVRMFSSIYGPDDPNQWSYILKSLVVSDKLD